jgi:hypothetical protein
MLGSPGLHLQDDLGLVDVQARGEALVRHLEHVRAEVGQIAEELGERAGRSGSRQRKAR